MNIKNNKNCKITINDTPIGSKSADEMFEELGYRVIENNKTTLNYEKEGLYMDKEIIFELLDKSISTGYGTGECCHITMEELQAINKKCQELGWI